MLRHLNSPASRPARSVVLGAAGFVGGAVARRLEAEGCNVLALTRKQIDLLSPGAAEALGRVLRPEDALVMASARAPVRSNAQLIENLQMMAAATAALARVPIGHVVYISSDAVYADSDQPLTERSCAQPATLHGVMHLAREVMLANAYVGPLCLLRSTLIYGATDPHNGYGPNRFRRDAMAGRPIVLFGEGEERRDHVLIDDVAEIILRVLVMRSVGTLNISTGEVVSFREIADRIAELCPHRPAIKSTPRTMPMPHGGYRPFDVGACRSAFPDFRYTALREGLRRVHASELSPS